MESRSLSDCANHQWECRTGCRHSESLTLSRHGEGFPRIAAVRLYCVGKEAGEAVIPENHGRSVRLFGRCVDLCVVDEHRSLQGNFG